MGAGLWKNIKFNSNWIMKVNKIYRIIGKGISIENIRFKPDPATNLNITEELSTTDLSKEYQQNGLIYIEFSTTDSTLPHVIS